MDSRALNRATLDRQLLLRRHPLTASQAVAHLTGMQAQAPLAPYTGLWTRLRDFTPEALSTLISERLLLRAHLMRNTVHLLTAQDYLDFRPMYHELGERRLQSSFGSRLAGVDLEQVRSRARAVLSGRSLTRAELGKELAEHWPQHDPDALAHAATHLIPLVQVPPRGIWGRSGPAAWALADEYLGQPLSAPPADLASAERLVLRYLAAFGPATVRDIQAWSGLTRLREVTDRLSGRLRAFGGGLLDLPDAPRPDPDTPAPPRFLPEYDNLLLSHADRSRVIPHNRPVPLPPGNGSTQGTLLIDGHWNATWKLTSSALEITPFTELTPQETDAITTEAATLLAFLTPPQTPRDLHLHPPAS
jgi:Winged helix DNA-binding domain